MNDNLSLRSCIEKYPVLLYCILAFLITWGLKLLFATFTLYHGRPAFNFSLIASYGPSLAAVILFGLSGRRTALRNVWRRIIQWRVGIRWILLSVLFEPIAFSMILLMYILYYGMPLINESYTIVSAAGYLLLTFFIGIIRWGLAEEIGWRGWMLPKLLEKMPPFRASIILAVVVSAWHINPVSFPDYFTVKEGTLLIGYYPEIVERIIISVPITMVMTYIFIRTTGSLLPAILFHSASNTSYFWIKDVFGIVSTDFFRIIFLILLVVILIIFSILLIKLDLKRSGKV